MSEDGVTRGANYTIEIREARIHVRVFRREDMTMEDGARLAQELAERLIELGRRPALRSVILDLREAPSIAGPKTRASLAAFMSAWSASARPMAIVVGGDPIKEVQFQHLIDRMASAWGRVVPTLDAAERWCTRT